MYIVKWKDNEGNWNEKEFINHLNAVLEAKCLEKTALYVAVFLREHMYEVVIRDKRTGENLNLRVWARTENDAPMSVALLGINREYSWLSTEPIYENNQLITREIKL